MSDQKMFNPFEGPMQRLMELNVKMMQNLSYIKPVDLFSAKKPEEFFARNVEMLMQNNHMALNYMKEIFSILEVQWLDASRNLDRSTQKMVDEVSSIKPKSTKKSSISTKSTTKPVVKNASSNKIKSATKKSSASVKKDSEKKTMKVSRPTVKTKTLTANTPKQKIKSVGSKSNVIHANESINKMNSMKENMPN